jgi:phenylacetate-CoA ligase
MSGLTDAQRFPLLTVPGRRLLQRLREHPRGPRYTAESGNRLSAVYLARVRAYAAELETSTPAWPDGGLPGWLDEFVTRCLHDVPYYRAYGERPRRFSDLPTVDRGALSRQPWAFVPDPLPLTDLILYATSGTTGHPITVPSHPVVAASYLPLYRAALRRFGVELKAGAGQVGSALVGYQRQSFTYASVTPEQDEAGHLKLNLHPADWGDPADRAAFLDDCDPEIYTGDPIAFAELMRLPLRTRPRALVSTAMMLTPGLRQRLESHFGCPVLDLYSMNEAGPLAVREGAAAQTGPTVFGLLQHRVYIEILAPDGQPCPPGLRGEVTLTGGLNFCLPLLRYRTNDYAALEWRGGRPVLIGLEGRPPAMYRGAAGQLVNSLDVSAALRPFALPQFTFHQAADGALTLRLRESAVEVERVRAALIELFGARTPLTVEMRAELTLAGDKVVQFTSDLPTAWPD